MRSLTRLLAVVLALAFVAEPASAAIALHAEKPASGSETVVENLIGGNARLSGEGVREIPALAYDFTSDFPVAARGAASTTSIVGRSVGAREAMWSGKKLTNELAESLGMDRRQLGKAVESIKKHYGLPGDHNVTIGRASGDVYDSKTGELLGNVLDEIGKW